tara:strand:+ start:67 stop:555 length:489 start_codon:yes stop_codon:yes gene_type:complete
MLFTLFISIVVPILIFNDLLIRKPGYLFSKILFYLTIPLQALSFTAGTYPDFVDNNYYNTAFRIDFLLQLVFLYLFFMLIRFLKNKIFKKIQKTTMNITPIEEYSFILKVKFIIKFIYGKEKNISTIRDLVNLGIHIFLIFVLSSTTLLNLSRFYDWYIFYF